MTTYSPSTALIVVDVQNDFADPEGSLFVPGAPQVLDFINDQMRQARETGTTVVRTQDWHPASTPHFAKDGGIWPDHCVAGTWGAMFHPSLLDEGTVVRKGVGGEDGYSGFSVRDPVTGEEQPTGLDQLLTDRGVAEVIVVGLATDYCVKETAIDAVRYGFGSTVLADGVSAVDLEPGDGARACAEMVIAGVAIR
ncbi:MAG: bifunctional nicotinamidase/pyrazinamidase [Acidimicrobiia bacterium]|nr:MAG: bifunctional nicotinamidase/pyrazinamidase [Acidimicrobiia bacterium]